MKKLEGMCVCAVEQVRPVEHDAVIRQSPEKHYSEGKLPEDKDSETGQYDKYGPSGMTQ